MVEVDSATESDAIRRAWNAVLDVLEKMQTGRGEVEVEFRWLLRHS